MFHWMSVKHRIFTTIGFSISGIAEPLLQLNLKSNLLVSAVGQLDLMASVTYRTNRSVLYIRK